MESSRPPHRSTHRRLAAVLAADVAGFSRLMGADEEGTHRTLTAHRAILDSAIARHGGRIVNTAGDSVLAEFASVIAAAEAAVAAQTELGEANEALGSDVRLAFRIGINLGDVIVDGHDIFGDGVNIAARVQTLASPGGICISGTVYDQIRNRLSLAYRSLGAQSVKNIAEPIRVYAIDVGGALSTLPPGSARARSIAVAVGGAVLIAVLGGLWFSAERSVWVSSPPDRAGAASQAPPLAASSAESQSSRPVIAVLPFENQSGSAQHDYLGDGMSEELINALGRFSNFSVLARNSSFAYRGRNETAPDLGRALGARYLIDGTVRRAEDQLRITVRLTDAARNLHLWSQRYDAPLADVFRLQDEMTRGIAGALAVKLTQIEGSRLFSRPTKSLEAYDLVLRGRYLVNSMDRTANADAGAVFEKALALDPRYADVHVGLGERAVNAVILGWSEDPDESLERARAHAESAIRLDGSNASAFSLLGQVLLWRREHARAAEALEQALRLNPSDVDARGHFGSARIWAGRTSEGIAALEAARTLDPNITSGKLVTLGFGYYLAERYDAAIDAFQTAAVRAPDHFFTQVGLAATYAVLGRTAEAREAAARVRRLQPFFDARSFGAIIPDPAQRARISEGLAKAGLD